MLMIVLMISMNGCVHTLEKTDSFCIWAKPITINKSEFEFMSQETLIQLDNFNRHYEQLCVNGEVKND